jgi:co-chaperonin GroES (HSP10)
MPRIVIKEVDVPGVIAGFPVIPYGQRLYAVEKEIDKVGLVIIPSTPGENSMQTNEGWVIAVGGDVDFCIPGDEIFFGRYSGFRCVVGDQKYRVMNEEDILGKLRGEEIGGG